MSVTLYPFATIPAGVLRESNRARHARHYSFGGDRTAIYGISESTGKVTPTHRDYAAMLIARRPRHVVNSSQTP